MPFSSNLKIVQLTNIIQISSGKSGPLRLEFRCQNMVNKVESENKIVFPNRSIFKQVIMKYNYVADEDYLMESNSANFFKKIGLIDEGTY